MKIDLVSLDECPEGLFLFNGTLCFKSEYQTQNQSSGYWQSDAYVVSSGEYFWGGASTAEARDKLLVTPVPADHIDAIAKENEWLRGVVGFLFGVLDDIDTADDLAKGNEKLYRNLVRRHHERRWETGIKTDGYDLDLSELVVPETQRDPETMAFNQKAALQEQDDG